MGEQHPRGRLSADPRQRRSMPMSTVRGILQRKGTEVHSVSSEATVLEAIETMSGHNVGSLVVKDGETVIGMVTERDYLRKVVLLGRASKTTVVSEIMSSPVVFARVEDDVERCMTVMTERRLRHLPVMGADGLVGLVSVGDVIKQLVRDKDTEISELQAYVQGSY